MHVTPVMHHGVRNVISIQISGGWFLIRSIHDLDKARRVLPSCAKDIVLSNGGNKMENLQSLVQGYFESAGFKVEDRGEYLFADKLGFGLERDTRLVWVAPPGRRPDNYENKLQESISAVRQNYPDAKACVLASSREGFSRDLLRALTQSRIKFLVPIQFFDTPFKVEDAPRTVSAIAGIRSSAASQKGVPQPFRLDTESNDTQQDLFLQLRDELTKPEAPTIRIIVGRAGIGKSFLFQALFARLYEDFLSAKKEQQTRPRPIPLLPEHLRETHALRIDSLIDNFLRTDIAVPIGGDTFQWLVVNGFATWLLDGLDELYTGDPHFFDRLLDLVTAPGSRAQITVWCRDSLLTTSDAFSEFRESYGSDNTLKIYHLSEWERKSKRQFVWLKQKDRLPRNGERDPDEIENFLKTLNSNPTLKAISSLPFYCNILLQQSQDGAPLDFRDDVELLNHVTQQMIDREIEKGLLDMDCFEGDGLSEWLEQIAVECIQDRHYVDIDTDLAKQYGQIVLRSGLDDQIRENMLTSLLQFPLFQAGREEGRIAFTHDLIAEALAAPKFLKRLHTEPSEVVCTELSRIELEQPTLLRFMARRLDLEGEKCLIEKVIQPRGNQARGFAIGLSLLLLSRPERDLLKKIRVNMEDRNLVAVRFKERDLSGVSFRRSDLSYATFTDCDLRKTCFDGAFFKSTRFEGENQMEGAEAGNLNRVQSIWIGRQFEDSLDKIGAWFEESTGIHKTAGVPCLTACQILYLLRKYITPLGEPRRDELDRRGLLAGKHFAGSAQKETCVNGLVRYGYLTSGQLRDRGRFRRSEGSKYAEMVAFVHKGNISDGIGGLIAELCPRRGCAHQLDP